MPESDLAASVVIADDDLFEGGYVVAALVAAGQPVIGPVRSSEEVYALIDGRGPPRAVVLAVELADGPSWDLAEALRTRDIAHLLLIGRSAHEDHDLRGRSVLQKPFGAYQVVEWVAQCGAAHQPAHMCG